MNPTLLRVAAAALLCAAATPVFALNILVCNDDGITAANVRALKQRLFAAGHDVIISAPIDNQSGTGGFIRFLQPVAPLTGNERGAKALQLPAGTPASASTRVTRTCTTSTPRRRQAACTASTCWPASGGAWRPTW